MILIGGWGNLYYSFYSGFVGAPVYLVSWHKSCTNPKWNEALDFNYVTC